MSAAVLSYLEDTDSFWSFPNLQLLLTFYSIYCDGTFTLEGSHINVPLADCSTSMCFLDLANTEFYR